MGNGDGTFKPQVTYDAGYNPSGISLADINGDGNEDIIVANQNDGTASVLMGNGDGTFAAPVTYSSGDYQPNGVRETSVAVGDLNDDGLPDLVTADRYGNTIRVLLSQGRPDFGPDLHDRPPQQAARQPRSPHLRPRPARTHL